MRIDKFLKVSRIVKQRSKARELCISGKVQINETIAKPSTKINVGDQIYIVRRSKKSLFTVLNIPSGNVSKEKAKALIQLEKEILIDE